MHPSNYTPDTICRSMGLPAFIELGWRAPTLRLLLKPSFNPEVCLTLTGTDSRLSIVALSEMLWHQPMPLPIAAFREDVTVAKAMVSQAISEFGIALTAERALEGRMFTIDGMPITCCLLTDDGLEQFSGHPYRETTRGFVSSLISLAWEAASDVRIRNSLAECGKYLGLTFPREQEPIVQELCRIAVLGTLDDRSVFFEQLKSAAERADR